MVSEGTGATSAGLEEAARTFSGAGLELPPVPDEMRAGLRTTQRWCFATRPVDPMALYLFRGVIRDVLTMWPEDHVAFCHAGHGLNSYALTYVLIRDPIAIIAQIGWGGAYMDNGVAAQCWADQMRSCGRVIAAAESAQEGGRIPPGRRLVMAESDIRGVGLCGWLGRPEEHGVAPELAPREPGEPDRLVQGLDILNKV
jgi:hypothetical protein